MIYRQWGDQIDDVVQPLPVFAESLFPNIKGSHCKRNQQQEGDQPVDHVGLFQYGLSDETPGETVVKVDEDEQVDGGIHERIETQCTAAFEQFTPSENSVERRTGQG
jgi:hypothetical protein